jgi:hypothetical protein
MALFIRRENKSESTTNYLTPQANGDASVAIAGGSGNNVTVYNTGEQAFQSVDNAVTGAFNFGARSLDSVDKAVLASLLTSAQASQAAISAAQASARDALGANLTVSSNAMDLTNRAMGTVANSFADSLNYVGHITDLALEQSQRVDQISAGAIAQVARSYDTATNYQAEKATLDSRYMVVAGMIVIGLAAVKMWGKA